jgi:hypothetical protein
MAAPLLQGRRYATSKTALSVFGLLTTSAFKLLIKQQQSIDKRSFLYRMAGAGWFSVVSGRAHNPKVVGSNPAPATRYSKRPLNRVAFLFLLFTQPKHLIKNTILLTADDFYIEWPARDGAVW